MIEVLIAVGAVSTLSYSLATTPSRSAQSRANYAAITNFLVSKNIVHYSDTNSENLCSLQSTSRVGMVTAMSIACN